MASTTSMPVEQPQGKLSFAKVAASAYKPQLSNDSQPNSSKPVITGTPSIVPSQHPQQPQQPVPSSNDTSKARNESEESERVDNTASRTGQWASSTGPQVALGPNSKNDVIEKLRPVPTVVKPILVAEDSSTQLSSSDGSAKPPSIDGKSVASATTFALDEKESLRPDDSASLRAVEEEDVTSPPDSVAAGSRVGSDSGAARAFRDQLQEIAVMGPIPQRGAPPGRFPNPATGSSHTLYDPNQPPNPIGRSMSQPLVNGLPTGAGPHSIPAIPDEKLIEALESPRDRLFVLKLEQDILDFIKDSRENELSLPNTNTFYRMLAHRLADYYLLGHVVDNTMTGVKITRTSYCRIPPPLSGLPVSSKNGSTPPVELPTRKIMRRGHEGKSGTNTTTNSEGPSKTTSEADGASGSDGGNEGENKDKSSLTREEREARYREARQRIFGDSAYADGDSSEVIGSGEEKDISRSSSASGKRKSKKQRNYDDDDFEARSRYTTFYPQQYAASGFVGENPVYYGGYAGSMQNPQYAGMGGSSSPPPPFVSGYPMMGQDAQPAYGWQGQQYHSSNGSMAYPSYAAQSGYDLSGEFQRGMQSFQSAPMPSQVTPKMTNVPMAPYQDPYQAHPLPVSNGWPQMTQQNPYAMGQSPYVQQGTNSRPLSAPLQGPSTPSYPYNQFSTPSYHGSSTHGQHPLPGSFNRQQFNPQSQSFIPGGRNGPFPMQPNMNPLGPQNMNGYSNYPVPITPQMSSQMPHQLGHSSPPMTHQQTFGSPLGVQNSNSVPVQHGNGNVIQIPQVASSQSASSASALQSMSSVPPQSSIAKWGTPSHLPPKPPAPAQPQTPKFNLQGSYGPRLQ